MPDIRHRIIAIRETLGITKQSVFAEKLDIKRTTLIGYENGTSPPSTDFLLKVSEIYNVSIDWLLTGGGEMFLGPKPEEKHPLIADLEALIDKKIESRIANLESRLKKAGSLPPEDRDSGLYALEPKPEYGAEHKEILFVENVAAGRPIYQSDDRSVHIKVPGQLIKTKPEDYYAARIKGTSMTAAGIPDGCLALFQVSDTPRDGAIQLVEHQGEATVKRMREVPGEGWQICFEDGSGKVLDVGPGQEFHIQGDFVAVLPEDSF